MNDLKHLQLYAAGAPFQERQKIAKKGGKLRTRVGTFWGILGLALLSIGLFSIAYDVFRFPGLRGAAQFIIELIYSRGRLELPAYTPYLGAAAGFFFLLWSANFMLGKNWAWLVGLWVNGIAALLWLVGAIYLAQISWPGFEIGSLKVSRLWLVGLLVLLGLLFSWINYRLYSQDLRQSYYINTILNNPALDELSRDMNKAMQVCGLCGRPKINGRCSIHNPLAYLIDQDKGGSYELKESNIVIGRTKGTLQLDPAYNDKYKTISNPHAQLFVDQAGNWFLLDLSHHKREGRTEVEGKPLSGETADKPITLTDNLKIKLGEASFVFRIGN